MYKIFYCYPFSMNKKAKKTAFDLLQSTIHFYEIVADHAKNFMCFTEF